MFDHGKSRQMVEFHQTYGVGIRWSPGFPSPERCTLRVELIREEAQEFKDAVKARDIVEAADALADLLYVTYGAAVELGIPIDEVFDEVHRSNMSKLDSDGKPILREDGKILKGPNFFLPKIQEILEKHDYSGEVRNG